MRDGGSTNIEETEIKGIIRYAIDHIRIYRIKVETLPRRFTNAYLILDNDTTLVDVGFDSKRAREDMYEGFEIINSDFKEDISIKDVNNIFITHGHGDHFGMLASKILTGKRVYIHSLDVCAVRDYPAEYNKWKQIADNIAREAGCYINPNVGEMWTPDKFPIFAENYDLVEVEDKQKIINGYQVYHTPGHSPGHICLKIGPVLFLGDHILSFTTPHQSPKSSWEGGGLENYISSLKKVSEFDIIHDASVDCA